MFYVYVLRSQKDKKLHVGFTKNINQRLASHNEGKNVSTKNRRPLQLIYCEVFTNEKDARAKETFYKIGRGHEVIYNALRHYFISVGRPSDSEGS